LAVPVEIDISRRTLLLTKTLIVEENLSVIE